MWLSRSRGCLAPGWWGASPSGGDLHPVARGVEDALPDQGLGVLEELFVDGREGGTVLDSAHHVLEAGRGLDQHLVVVGIVRNGVPDRLAGGGHVVGVDRVPQDQKTQFLELASLRLCESCHTLPGERGAIEVPPPRNAEPVPAGTYRRWSARSATARR